MWQEMFYETLRHFVECREQVSIHSPQELLTLMTNETNTNRRSMWPELAVELGATTQQVHDYYHNTWTKQFYENVKFY